MATGSKRTALAPLLVVLVIALAGVAWLLDSTDQVVFFPTYGYQEGSGWTIPMRAKVLEVRSTGARFSELFVDLPASTSGPSHVSARVADFLADDKSFEQVELAFDDDPERVRYRITGTAGSAAASDGQGIVAGAVQLTDAVARSLLAAQKSNNGWLTYRAVSRGHDGVGRVRLIEPTGISVVSDIDDTIKITEIPAGELVIAVNSFVRAFVPTTELNARYAELAGASFHYVSGGPWQMYRPLQQFLAANTVFPEGTFHMKPLSGGISTPIRSYQELAKFVQSEGTYDHKVAEITALMERFGRRDFVLIGDSGERDPDVYRAVKAKYGARVKEIIIRDVANVRELDPDKLAGMTVVPAPTAVKGVSQFTR